MRIQFKRDTTSVLDQYIGSDGELAVDIEKRKIRLFNGETVGGFEVANLDEIPTDSELEEMIESFVIPAEQRANDYTDLREVSILSSMIKTEPMVVENDQEADYQKGEEQDFKDVFENWIRFSHLDGERPYDETHLDEWEYDEEQEVIRSTLNAPSTVGFVSTESYENYILDVIVDSTNSDDDLIGLVLAYTVDDDGMEHTITAMRTPGGIGHNADSINDGRRMLFQIWMNVADYKVDNPPTVDLGTTNKGLKWGDTGEVDEDREIYTDVGSWADWNGCRIRVERNGDHFKIETSQLGETELVDEAKVEFTLNDHPELARFKGPKPYGYCQHSQDESFYETLGRPIEIQSILDISGPTQWEWDGQEWISKPLSEENFVTPHRLYYNNYYDRLYVSDENRTLKRLPHQQDVQNAIVGSLTDHSNSGDHDHRYLNKDGDQTNGPLAAQELGLRGEQPGNSENNDSKFNIEPLAIGDTVASYQHGIDSTGDVILVLSKLAQGHDYDVNGTLLIQRSSNHSQCFKVDVMFSTAAEDDNPTGSVSWEMAPYRSDDADFHLVEFTLDGEQWVGVRYQGYEHWYSTGYFLGECRYEGDYRLTWVDPSEVSNLEAFSGGSGGRKKLDVDDFSTRRGEVVTSNDIKSIKRVTEEEYPTDPDPEVLYIVVED